jgi:large subunit ribosomal protein L14
MIQNKTFLKLADNSGATVVECIRVYKPKYNKLKIGFVILVTVKEIKLQSKLRVGSLHKAIVVRIKQKFSRQNGNYLQFADNSVILLNLKSEYYGTRLLGPISTELRKKKIVKLLSLTTYIF